MKKNLVVCILMAFAFVASAQISDTSHHATEDTTIYSIADIHRQPHKETSATDLYIRKPVQYPQSALDNGTEGIVKVSFIIEKDGSISNLRVIKKVAKELDKEAVRVIKSSNMARPFLLNGNPVRVRDTIPVTFSIRH